jgi:ketosteroid isomerase-like protein
MLMITRSGLAQDPIDLIRQIMTNQERCWNSGDLECFMQDYWQSDSLMFVSASRVYYGYNETLARYRDSYPDRTAMGQLNFELITLEQLSATAIFVVGKYHLERDIGNKQGHFTLLWRKIDGKWLIVVDHSS